MMKRTIEKTADGSCTLFVPEMEEHYHSVNGALQESRHVFFQAGWEELDRTRYRILEFGFGTGLNALLAVSRSECEGVEVTYYTIEKFPLSADLWQQLHYESLPVEGAGRWFSGLHESPWDENVSLTSRFILHKILGDFHEVSFPEQIDLVFFDAFAPDKQPEVWSQQLFDRIFRVMAPGGVLVTYCAKGVVRRMLQQAGFVVERIPGPPGKREMLRARVPSDHTDVDHQRQL